MARRQDQAVLIGLVPPWTWLAIAGLSYLALHWLAGHTPSGTAPQILAQAMWKGFATVGQFLVPFVFTLAGAASALARRRRSASAKDRQEAVFNPETPRVEPSIGEDLYGIWKEASQSDAGPPPPDTTRWSRELINALEWKRFEQLGAAYFRTLGFRVEEATHGPDGGVDLRLYEHDAKHPGILVQCKAWKSWTVGVKEIRELFGVMAAENVREGIFLTSSTFTAEAVQFARGKDVVLIDGEDLLKKALNLPADDQRHILALLTQGDFTTPTCPSCGIKMVQRAVQGGGQSFWGCVRFPQCRSTIQIGRGRL